MALTGSRIWGFGVTLKINSNEISQWLSISYTDPDDHVEATAASSKYDQYFEGRHVQREMTITGYLGEIDDGNIPKKGDYITAVSVAQASDELMPDFGGTEDFGAWKVAEVNYDYGLDPFEWSIVIKSGMEPEEDNGGTSGGD